MVIAPNILKEGITHLEPTPWPQPDKVGQVRAGKVKKLGKGDNGEVSGIFKEELEGAVFISYNGVTGDNHVYGPHKERHRAVHQYAAPHYANWRDEKPDRAHLFQVGGFGENLVTTHLTEANVCIGDIWHIGEDLEKGILLEVSEPRSPCYKLTIRFDWGSALKRIQKTARVGWNFRTKREGFIKAGDTMTLVERPNPRWSIQNVQKVLYSRSVEPSLIEELDELEVLTPFFHNLAQKRLRAVARPYRLIDIENVTSRVKQLTFQLTKPMKSTNVEFQPYSYAQIKFGPNRSLSRSYSIVSGNLEKFTLGVALDDHSRGGSKYIHENLKVGHEIMMGPGFDEKAAEHEELCQEECIDRRIVIIGGIGVTAFLPVTKQWEEEKVPFEVHYAVRSRDDAAFIDTLSKEKTTIYSKAESLRLDVGSIIPPADADGKFHARVFCCGPTRLMDACKARASELGYPDHLLHFEDFGTATGGDLGPPFEVDVYEPDSGRKENLQVPSDKTLLQVLTDAGFDILSNCQAGGCGTCKVTVCSGKVDHKSDKTGADDPGTVMLTCVDRARSKIQIEVD